MARIPASPYPLGEEIDYTRLLTRLYTEWWNASTTEIKTALSFIRDAAWSDAIFERIGKTWPELVEKSKPLIERIMKRVSDKNFIRWSKQVEAATNKRVILSLNPFHSEPWLDLFMSERVAENIRLIKDIGTQSASKMQQILEDGIRSGKSTRELVKELQTTFDYGKKRVKLIARDQIGKHNGLLNELRQKNAGVDEYIWSTSKDERVRSAHRAREGQTFKWSDPPSDGHPGQPIQCFPAGSKVTMNSDIVRLYRRRYTGELTQIGTHEGGRLQGTPNHPVLTSRGWVPLKEINIGDYVVQTHFEGNSFSERNKKNAYAGIDELFDFFFDSGCCVDNVAGFSGQFHGDGITHQNVDIVTIEGGLLGQPEPLINKKLCQQFLSESLVCLPSLSTSNHGSSMFRSVFGSSDCIVSGASELASFCFGHSTHSDDVCLATIAKLYAVHEQVFGNSISGDSVLFGKMQGAISAGIVADKSIFVNLLGIVSRAVMPDNRMPFLSTELAESVRTESESPGNLTNISAGLIHRYSRVNSVSAVVSVHKYVYNLENINNWYLINNYTTKNCRCTAIPKFPENIFETLVNK